MPALKPEVLRHRERVVQSLISAAERFVQAMDAGHGKIELAFPPWEDEKYWREAGEAYTLMTRCLWEYLDGPS